MAGKPQNPADQSAAERAAQLANGDGPVKGEVVDPDGFDLDLTEFRQLKVKIGTVDPPQAFRATEPSIEVQKQIIEMLPESSGKDDVSKAESLANVSSVYDQMQRILSHADGPREGKPPEREWLEANLSMGGVGRLMRKLNSDDEEGKGG